MCVIGTGTLGDLSVCQCSGSVPVGVCQSLAVRTPWPLLLCISGLAAIPSVLSSSPIPDGLPDTSEGLSVCILHLHVMETWQKLPFPSWPAVETCRGAEQTVVDHVLEALEARGVETRDWSAHFPRSPQLTLWSTWCTCGSTDHRVPVLLKIPPPSDCFKDRSKQLSSAVKTSFCVGIGFLSMNLLTHLWPDLSFLHLSCFAHAVLEDVMVDGMLFTNTLVWVVQSPCSALWQTLGSSRMNGTLDVLWSPGHSVYIP